MTSSATRTPSGSASRQMSSALRNAAARALSPGWAFAAGVPRCTTRTSNGMRRATCSAASASRTAACRRALSATALESGSPQWPPTRPVAMGACMLLSVSPVSDSQPASTPTAASSW